MQLFVLVASDNNVYGVYSTKEKLISDLSTVFLTVDIKNVEVWELDKGFVEYLEVSRRVAVNV